MATSKPPPPRTVVTTVDTLDGRRVLNATLTVLRAERLKCGCERLSAARPGGGRVELCIGAHCEAFGRGPLVLPVQLVDCEVCDGKGIMTADFPGMPDVPQMVVLCPTTCKGGARFEAADPYMPRVETVLVAGGVL